MLYAFSAYSNEAEAPSIQFMRVMGEEVSKVNGNNYLMRFNGLSPSQTYVLTLSRTLLDPSGQQSEICSFQMLPSGLYMCNGNVTASVGVTNSSCFPSERATYRVFAESGKLVTEGSIVPKPIEAIGKDKTFTVSVEYLNPLRFTLNWEGIEDGETVRLIYDYGSEKGETVTIPSEYIVTMGPKTQGVDGGQIKLRAVRANGDTADLQFEWGLQLFTNLEEKLL